ncbi:MAG: ABC transporter permease [Pleurocapsa sp.]
MDILDRKIIRELWQQRGQVIALGLVLVCGIASFLMALSAYSSVKLTQSIYYDNYHFAHVFASVKRAPISLADQIEAIAGVARVETRIVKEVTLDVPQLNEPATGRLISLPENRPQLLNRLHLRRGRYLEPTRSNEILISEAFAEANQLQLEQEIGAVINGKWQKLRIVGIVLSPEYVYEVRGGSDVYPDNKRFGVIWMGQEALAHAFDLDSAFNDVTLTLNPNTQELEVIDHLDRLLENYGGLGAYSRKDQVSHRIFTQKIDDLKNLATFLPTIFLGIAAFLINVILSRLVATQREQIGVLKAFGYSNLTLGFHYLKFILAIVSGGVAIGSMLGFWLGKQMTLTYTQFFRLPIVQYRLEIGLVTVAVLLSLIASTLGGLKPVVLAISLPPATAMRPEPPAQFKPTIMEQFGLERFFSPVIRILVRNLERKFSQALFSIVGIALAIAILVAGNYISDAMNYIAEVQFNNVQREDVAIIFNEAIPGRAIYEVNDLPGVLQSEPFRTVPVRLRYQQNSYRLNLTGILPNGELRRLVDRHLNLLQLPNNGLVLSIKLAEILQVNPGKTVTVEVLEGKRLIREIPVVGLVDELLGLSAYINLDALNRMLEEDLTISGTYLSVDDRSINQLFTHLKTIPAIGGVSNRQTSLKSFQEFIAQNLEFFTKVLVIFACIITFSIIYNSARISLAERKRELASLKILGFSHHEIAFILLGEQLILVLIAIPIGFILGYFLAFLMSLAYNSEIFRLPLIVERHTYFVAFLIVIITAFSSSLIIYQKLKHLDLIEVFKNSQR